MLPGNYILFNIHNHDEFPIHDGNVMKQLIPLIFG